MRHTWEISAVIDVDGAAAACRNYWEFRDLRDVLSRVVAATVSASVRRGGSPKERRQGVPVDGGLSRVESGAKDPPKIDIAYDVGCGYGRLLNLLGEFATSVTGFEREPALVDYARQLSPAASVIEVPELSALPAADGSADIVLCFTVLQHLTDAELAAVVPELLRVRRPSGAIVLVEETDGTLEAGKPERADLGYTKGRPVAAYAALLAPLTLVHAQPRRIEPTYPRPDVGTYMVFQPR